MNTQTLLSSDQLVAFYHDEFVTDQVRHFVELVDAPRSLTVADIGGGCGFFAKHLESVARHRVRVIDVDPQSIAVCRQTNVEAEQGDATRPPIKGDEEVVCFNLILHHLVGSSERITRQLQSAALEAWHERPTKIFVNEYIYESFIPNLSGRLIFQITKSSILSWIGRLVSRAVPSLKANTFGVGVRFRAHDEWVRLFADAGYDVRRVSCGAPEPVSAARRLLLIRQIRRDSFLLEPKRATR